MDYSYLVISSIVATITWFTFSTLNTLDNASKPDGCCSTPEGCGNHQVDAMVWWAHLGIAILSTLYVLLVVISEAYRMYYGKKLGFMM
tara:strand:+ start:2983 stop:3246 length:264 start_codon:yes stop_codon:yes gene_type:complete